MKRVFIKSLIATVALAAVGVAGARAVRARGLSHDEDGDEQERSREQALHGVSWGSTTT